MTTKEDLVKLVLRRYSILQKLYYEDELSVSQIAKKLAMDSGNTSRNIDELEEQGLVKTQRAPDAPRITKDGKLIAGGKPSRLCSLTMQAWHIMQAFEAEPVTDLTDGQIEELKALIEKNNLSIDFRAFVARKFSDIAIEHPDTLLENDSIRSLFETILSDNSTLDERISRALLSALSTSLMQRMPNKKTKTWFDQKIRKSLLAKVSDESTPESIKEWAINCLARAARISGDQKLLNETIDKFLELYFKKRNNVETVKNELLAFESKFYKTILEKIAAYTDDPEKRPRTEELLTALISLWISSDLSRKSTSKTPQATNPADPLEQN